MFFHWSRTHRRNVRAVAPGYFYVQLWVMLSISICHAEKIHVEEQRLVLSNPFTTKSSSVS